MPEADKSIQECVRRSGSRNGRRETGKNRPAPARSDPWQASWKAILESEPWKVASMTAFGDHHQYGSGIGGWESARLLSGKWISGASA
jgi:hypothetical protein